VEAALISEADFLDAYQSKDFSTYQACMRLLAHKEKHGKTFRKTADIQWHRDKKIPALAWLCKSTIDQTTFILGHRVEKLGRTFFEGVWDDSVEKANFRQSSNFFGSGCSFRKYLVFTPTRHCFDGLYTATCDGVTYVTNSLALLIKASLPDISDDELRILAVEFKEHTHKSTALGVDIADTFVTAKGSWSFYRLMYHNFGLGKDGDPIRIFNYEEQPAKTFNEYRENLEAVTQSIVKNAGSSHRKFPISVASTISNGYDSTACTAIVKTAGCDLAHTITGDVRGRSDSGEEIGAQLGVDVKPHAHILKSSDVSLRLSLDDEVMKYSAEFLATSGLGDDVVFASFGNDIENCVVFEGSFGDGIWAKNLRTGPGLPTQLPTAKSKNEFHLRNATIFIPLPVIGAKFSEGIRIILRQPDMTPYRLETRYDRPIPRRIVEEAGGKRESFGQRKGATAPTPADYEPQLATAFRMVMARYEALDDILKPT
jgi:hypothetical protein